MFTGRMPTLGWAVLALAGYGALTVPPAQADLLVVSGGISGGLDTILRYSDSGSFLGIFVPPGGGGLNGPDLGIIRGPDGNVYVNSFLNNAVMRYDVNTGENLPSPGNPGAQFVPSRSGGLNGPDGLGFGGPGGNLYVASGGDNTVKRYDPTTGAFSGTIVAPGFGGLANPKDLHFGPDGKLYLSNGDSSGKVLRYDPSTGDPMSGLGRTMANFIDPRPGFVANGFAFGRDGNLYVGFDNSSGVGGISKYDGITGNLIDANFVPLGSGGVGFIDGITFGPDGDLYVTDLDNNRVMRYSGSTGAFLDVFVDPSTGLRLPSGLLFVAASVPEPATLALVLVAGILAGACHFLGRWQSVRGSF